MHAKQVSGEVLHDKHGDLHDTHVLSSINKSVGHYVKQSLLYEIKLSLHFVHDILF